MEKIKDAFKKKKKKELPDVSGLPNNRAIATLAAHFLVEDKHLSPNHMALAIDNISQDVIELSANNQNISDTEKVIFAKMIATEFKNRIPKNAYSSGEGVFKIPTELYNIKIAFRKSLEHQQITRMNDQEGQHLSALKKGLQQDGLSIMTALVQGQKVGSNFFAFLPKEINGFVSKFVRKEGHGKAGVELYNFQETIREEIIKKREGAQSTPQALTKKDSQKKTIKALTFPTAFSEGKKEHKGNGPAH